MVDHARSTMQPPPSDLPIADSSHEQWPCPAFAVAQHVATAAALLIKSSGPTGPAASVPWQPAYAPTP